MPTRAKYYIDGTISLAILVLAAADVQWKSTGSPRYASYLLLGLIAATRKVRLPRIQSTISGGFVFVLVGIAEFSFGETMALALSTGFVQCVWRTERPQTRAQLVFNLSNLVNSAAAAFWLPRAILRAVHVDSIALLLLVAATVYFWINNLSVLAVVALVEDRPLSEIWRQCSLWSYAYFIIQTIVAVAISLCIRSGGWLFTLSIVALLLGGYFGFSKIATMLTSQASGRRMAIRHPANGSPVRVTWTDEAGRTHAVTARLIDISERGLGLESPEPINTPTVHIKAPEHDLDSLAEVRYSEFRGGKYVVGMELHFILNERWIMKFAPPKQFDESA